MHDQKTQAVAYAGPDAAPSRTWGLTPTTWMQIGTVVLLLCAVFWPNLRRLWLKTNPVTGEGNWTHSLFVPLIGLYYLYLNRDALLSPPAARRSFRMRALSVWVQAQAIIWGIAFFAWALVADTPSRQLMVIAPTLLLSAGSLIYALAASGRGPRQRSESRGLLAIVADSSSLWFGLAMLLWGLLFYAWAIWPGQNDFFKDCSMVATVFGAVLLLCGWPTMRIAWFPILFLLCAFPWPGLMYSKIAMPLQQLAASAAVGTLRIAGVDALRTGTQILINLPDGVQRALNVAEACAGLKSLMTFITLAAAIGFLSSRALWQKILITISAVPIAIFCNMLRVAGQGLLDHYWSHEWSEGFAHQFAGMVMLIPAFFLILLVCWILDHLLIEEVDTARASKSENGEKSLVIEIPRRAGADDVAAAALRLRAAQGRGEPARPAQPTTPSAPRQPSTPDRRPTKEDAP